jgi:hypothetical protein
MENKKMENKKMEKCFRECNKIHDISRVDFKIEFTKEYCKCILQCYKKNDDLEKKEYLKKNI